MSNKIINHGFTAPHVKQDHYVFGAEMVPKVVIRPDGQWVDFVPPIEVQSTDSFETCGCTVFGTNNAVEILEAVIREVRNYSDRFGYITSETQPPGNDPHIVAEAIRNVGMVDESHLPFTSDIQSLESFGSMDNKDVELIEEARAWAMYRDFKHEWVFQRSASLEYKQKALIECLRYSPIGVSVRAWQQRDNGLYYKNEEEDDTHWGVLVGYVEEKHWIFYDSYPDRVGAAIKLLEWNYNFGFAKRYYMKYLTSPRKLPGDKKENLFRRLINFITNLIKKI